MDSREVVKIEWVDAAWAEYADRPEVFSPIRSQAVGFVVTEAPDHITIAQEFFEDGSYRHLLAIPRAMIRTVDRVSCQ